MHHVPVAGRMLLKWGAGSATNGEPTGYLSMVAPLGESLLVHEAITEVAPRNYRTLDLALELLVTSQPISFFQIKVSSCYL